MPRLSIVSYLGNAANGPRAIRTRVLRERLNRDWTTELIAAPAGPGQQQNVIQRRPRVVSAIKGLHRHVLLDRLEPWAWANIRGRAFTSDAALLIGLPFSTVAYASRAIDRAGIPYVLDLGDFVVLGVPQPTASAIAYMRARRWERKMIGDAAGIVVAVESQKQAVLTEFPKQRVLVRPNGYEDFEVPTTPRPYPSSNLRMVHIGSVYEARVDVMPFLHALAVSGLWSTVTLVQIGRLEQSAIESLPESIRIEMLPPMPIQAAYEHAMTCDLALVVGNKYGLGVPSKTIQYLHLPLPRVALVAAETSELARFVSARESWVTIPWNSSGAAATIRAHIDRKWSPEDLAPPESESWHRIADQIAAFVAESVR